MNQSWPGLEIIAVGHLFLTFLPTSSPSLPILLEILSPSLDAPLISALALLYFYTQTQRGTIQQHSRCCWCCEGPKWGEGGMGAGGGGGGYGLVLLMSALTKPRSRPWIANSSLHRPQTLAASDKTWRIACIMGKTASLHRYRTPTPPLPHTYTTLSDISAQLTRRAHIRSLSTAPHHAFLFRRRWNSLLLSLCTFWVWSRRRTWKEVIVPERKGWKRGKRTFY